MTRMLPDRYVPLFCPFADFAERYPDWTYHSTDLHGLDEVLDFATKTVLIDPKQDGAAWALAHATVHLDYDEHDGRGSFSSEQEQAANDIAEVRLAGSEGRAEVVLKSDYHEMPPLDGDPTILF